MAFREIDDELWRIVQKHLPPTKPHVGRPRRDPRGLFNGILYILTTGCTWRDIPVKYGTKSTIHRYHLELCEKGVYQAIFFDLLRSGYEIRKTRKIKNRKLQSGFRVDLSRCVTDTNDIQAQQGDRPVVMAINR
ncbi:MAG: transposase [Methanoculleus sp.]|jgi:transposase|nr:transposase [Methanoculleus sp.]